MLFFSLDWISPDCHAKSLTQIMDTWYDWRRFLPLKSFLTMKESNRHNVYHIIVKFGKYEKIYLPIFFGEYFAKFIRFAFTKSVRKFYQCKFHGIAGYACLILEKVAHSREWKHWKSENAFVAFIKYAPAQHIAIKLSFQELIFESITETFAREVHRNTKCHTYI